MRRKQYIFLISALFSIILIFVTMELAPGLAYADLRRSIITSNSTSATGVEYVGASIAKMEIATGVIAGFPRRIEGNGPWPQNAQNYCFLAAVQAIINYSDTIAHKPRQFPTRFSQGPSSGNPRYEVRGQLLYDMDHMMIPPGGPLRQFGAGAGRRPFTLANIAYDFGGDPRSVAYATDFELGKGKLAADAHYHQHIYHTSAAAASMAMAQSFARYSRPIIAFVNHGEHAVVVAGMDVKGNPLTDKHAQIEAVYVFNPWNQGWGAYLSSSYYARIPYSDWLNDAYLPSPWGGVNSWFHIPYERNGNLDPDPSIGIYQAGYGTRHPSAHHWIGQFVTVQYDGNSASANIAFNEHNQAMYYP